MLKFLYILILSIFLVSCYPSGSKQDNAKTKWTELGEDSLNLNKKNNTLFEQNISPDSLHELNYFRICTSSEADYQEKKSEIRNIRKTLNNQLLTLSEPKKTSFLDSTKNYLLDVIVNQILPHWYGTAWDFDGYTTIPKTGSISANYLITTVLMHAGFKLNRYKLAKLHAFDLVNSVCDSVFRFLPEDYEEFQKIIEKNLTEGLYLVGMDAHIGFILLKNKKIYFIHVNYLEPAEVLIELAENSEALRESVSYHIGKIDTNLLTIKWIRQEEIKIKTKK